MSKINDKAIKDYIDRALSNYIQRRGMHMIKMISSGGFLSTSVYDNRTVFSLEEMDKLSSEGFSAAIDLGAWLFNALRDYEPEKED